MNKSWFVAGTDTGVGKTAVSCALLNAAARTGLRTAAIKPVAAGSDDQGHNEDALQLQSAMTMDMDYGQVNPVLLTAPIAPHIAASHEGKSLQASRLAGLCRGVMLSEADFVLVEGAGGWRVPLNPRETLADLAVELKVGVILVVGMRLGCINHALLTAQAIRADGLRLAGWVANSPNKEMDCYQENLDTLRQGLAAPLLGEVAHLSPFDAGVAAQSIDLSSLYH